MLNEKYNGGFVERIGCIEIMDNVFIGAGTRIMYNTRIGSNVVIGAGSLVTKDIPDNTVYAGVPAKYICSFDEFVNKQKAYAEKFESRYGTKKLMGVTDTVAAKEYEVFLKEKGN